MKHVWNNTVTVDGVAFGTGSVEYSANGGLSIKEEPCATGQTTVINAPLDVSAVKAFFLVSTQDVTVKTNSNSTPDDTLVLKANRPYRWNSTDSYDTFKLASADIVTIHVTNASGSEAKLTLLAASDVTP